MAKKKATSKAAASPTAKSDGDNKGTPTDGSVARRSSGDGAPVAAGADALLGLAAPQSATDMQGVANNKSSERMMTASRNGTQPLQQNSNTGNGGSQGKKGKAISRDPSGVNGSSQNAADEEDDVVQEESAPDGPESPLRVMPLPHRCPMCFQQVVAPRVLHIAPHGVTDSDAVFTIGGDAPTPDGGLAACLACESCAARFLDVVLSTPAAAPVSCPQCAAALQLPPLEVTSEEGSNGIARVADRKEALVLQPMLTSTSALRRHPELIKNTIVQNKDSNNQSAPSQSQSSGALCGICEEGEAVVSCVECRFSLCAECRDGVHSKGKFKRHQTVPLGASVSQQCPIHPRHPIDMYCRKCRAATCLMCAYDGCHKGHDVEPLDRVTQQLKATVESCSEHLTAASKTLGGVAGRLRETTGPAIAARAAAATYEINSCFKAMRTALEVREEELVRDVATRAAEAEERVAGTAAAVEAVRRDVDATVAAAQSAFAMEHPMVLLQLRSAIRARLASVATTPIVARAIASAVDANGENGEDGHFPTAFAELLPEISLPVFNDEDLQEGGSKKHEPSGCFTLHAGESPSVTAEALAKRLGGFGNVALAVPVAADDLFGNAPPLTAAATAKLGELLTPVPSMTPSNSGRAGGSPADGEARQQQRTPAALPFVTSSSGQGTASSRRQFVSLLDGMPGSPQQQPGTVHNTRSSATTTAAAGSSTKRSRGADLLGSAVDEGLVEAAGIVPDDEQLAFKAARRETRSSRQGNNAAEAVVDTAARSSRGSAGPSLGDLFQGISSAARRATTGERAGAAVRNERADDGQDLFEQPKAATANGGRRSGGSRGGGGTLAPPPGVFRAGLASGAAPASGSRQQRGGGTTNAAPAAVEQEGDEADAYNVAFSLKI